MVKEFAHFTDESMQKILSDVQAEIKQRKNKSLNDKANKEMLYIQENRRDLIDVVHYSFSGKIIIQFKIEN